MAMPSRPPAPESNRLSVSSCRTSRRRDAPIDRRTDTSRYRAAARDSRRFATFAHTINKQQDHDRAEDRRRSCRRAIEVVNAAGAGQHQQLRHRRDLPLVARELAFGVGEAGHEPIHAGTRGLLKGAGKIAFDLFERDAWLEAAGNLDIPVGRIVEAVLRGRACVERLRWGHELPLEHEWHPHVAHRVRHPLNADVRRRQYADNRDRRGVEPHGLARRSTDHRRSAAARTRG